MFFYLLIAEGESFGLAALIFPSGFLFILSLSIENPSIRVWYKSREQEHCKNQKQLIRTGSAAESLA